MLRVDNSGPNIVRGGTHGQCRPKESRARSPEVPGILSRQRLPGTQARTQAPKRSQTADGGRPGADSDAGRLRTLHFVAEDSVTDEYTLTLGAKFLLWGFPLALVILVVAETLLDTRWREPRR